MSSKCKAVINLCRVVKQDLERRANIEYVVNPTQEEKLHEVLNLLEGSKYLAIEDCKIQVDANDKRFQAVYISANCSMVDAFSEGVEEFIEILKRSSCFGITPRKDGTIDLEFTVPGVYLPKHELMA